MYSLLLIVLLYGVNELHAKDFPLPSFGGQFIPHDPRTNFTDIATFEPVVDVRSKRTKAIIEKFRQHHLENPDASFTFANNVTMAEGLIEKIQMARYKKQNTVTENSALHEPSEEPHFVKIIKSGCVAGNLFLDVGAASGYYCALAKRLCPGLTAVAINPSSHFRHAIMDTMDRNNVDEFISIPFAIGKTSGNIVALNNKYGGHLKGEKVTTGLEGRSTAFTVSMDQLLSSVEEYMGGEAKITLMMVDIQGYEETVMPLLSEAHFPFIQNIMVGTHGKAVHRALVKTLSKSPYSTYYKMIRKIETVPMQPDGLIQMALKQTLNQTSNQMLDEPIPDVDVDVPTPDTDVDVEI